MRLINIAGGDCAAQAVNHLQICTVVPEELHWSSTGRVTFFYAIAHFGDARVIISQALSLVLQAQAQATYADAVAR